MTIQYAFTVDIVRGYGGRDIDKATVYLAGIPLWQSQYQAQPAITHEEVMQDFAQALGSVLASGVPA